MITLFYLVIPKYIFQKWKQYQLLKIKLLNKVTVYIYNSILFGMILTKKFCLIKDNIETMSGKPHKCSYCDKVFSRFGNLVKHQRIHSDREKRYPCSRCDKAFYKKISLTRHFKRHTGEHPYQCNQCDKAFPCNGTLIVHMRKHTGERPYTCTLCNKAFSQNINLKSHMKTHTGEKQCKCDICGKTFLQNINLKYHLRIHTGEKPYKCSICNKAFKQISHVNRHIKTHTGERNFKCKQCDKAFTQNIDLVYHMRIHNEEKPFQCSHCNKSFLHKVGLVCHTKTHSREYPFQCSGCDKAFLYKTQIIRHLKTHSDEKKNYTKAVMQDHKGNMLPKKPTKCAKRINKMKKALKTTIEHINKDIHLSKQTKKYIIGPNNENKSDILGTKTFNCTKPESKKQIRSKEPSINHKNEVPQFLGEINLKKNSVIKGSEKINAHPKSTYKNGERSMTKDGEELNENGKQIQYRSLSNVDAVPQNGVILIDKADSKENYDIKYLEKTNAKPASTNKLKNDNTSKMKDSVEQTENGNLKSSSFNYEETFLSVSDVIEEIILSDSDEEFETCKSKSDLKKEDTANDSEATDYLHCAISKAFDWLEESTEGLWKRTQNQIEQDLYDVLQLHKLEIYENKLYTHIYCLDVNYRQLYLTFSGVDSMVLKHALLCKKKYRNCEDVPHKHQEDMLCCT